MLQLDTPEDFVIATGETRKLEDFVAAKNAEIERERARSPGTESN
jgi:GDP-D-mannose dehydratase